MGLVERNNLSDLPWGEAAPAHDLQVLVGGVEFAHAIAEV